MEKSLRAFPHAGEISPVDQASRWCYAPQEFESPPRRFLYLFEEKIEQVKRPRSCGEIGYLRRS